MWVRIAAVILLSVTSACVSETKETPSGTATALEWSEAELRSSKADVTSVSWTPLHGTQVTYSTPDGRIFLWYPGNEVILPGAWKVEPGQQPSLCYAYGANTRNPVTGHQGPAFACSNPALSVFQFIQTDRKGDVFNLSNIQRPPYVLTRALSDYDGVLARLPPARNADQPSRLARAVFGASAARYQAQTEQRLRAEAKTGG